MWPILHKNLQKLKYFKVIACTSTSFTSSTVPWIYGIDDICISFSRNRLEACECRRCQDPAEFGSFLSALKCPKCPINSNFPLLPLDPTNPDSDWTCGIHQKLKISAKNAQQLAIDLQLYLYAGGLTISIAKLEEKISMLENFLHPNHGLLLAAKRSLVNCYRLVINYHLNFKYLH